jgi:cellulase (glycosyl hydrolase family 5)
MVAVSLHQPHATTISIMVLGVAASLLILLLGTNAAQASTGFTTSGHTILRNGKPYTNYGFTLSDLQNGNNMFAKGEYQTVQAKMQAIKGTWHGNTVRLQIEQDAFLYGSGDNGATHNWWSAAVVQNKVFTAIDYAKSIGLTVVINDQTEPQDGIYSRNEPLPDINTLRFWQHMERYKNDPAVILDPFNEPRYLIGSATNYWNVWHNGYGGYVGANTLIRDIRSYGFTNQLWMEGPGNYAFAELLSTYPKYLLSDSRHNVVYSFHHTATMQNGVPTAAEWNTQFGNLVTQHNLPVVDGEWANRSIPYGTPGWVYKPSGDRGQCWSNAPVSVPAYLAYLKSHGIGLTTWTMGPNAAKPSLGYENADGGDLNSANNYANWLRCVTPQGARTSGSGQLLMNWFQQNN